MTKCTEIGCRNMRTICEDCSRTVDTKTFEVLGWISVKERLPEDAKDVLVYSKEFDRFCMAFYDRSMSIEGDWINIQSDCIIPSVTHWIPLPQPPKD